MDLDGGTDDPRERVVHRELHNAGAQGYDQQPFVVERVAQKSAEVARVLAAANSCFANGSCVISETADHLQRSLSRDGQAVLSIRYGAVPHYQGSTLYEHHERGYNLQVETLEVQAAVEAFP